MSSGGGVDKEIRSCPNTAATPSFLKTSGGHLRASRVSAHVFLTMIHGPVHAVCTFLILAEYHLRPFSSSCDWLGEHYWSPIRKSGGVFSRTICCFPWYRLSFSASPFLGDETYREKISRRKTFFTLFMLPIFIIVFWNHFDSKCCKLSH